MKHLAYIINENKAWCQSAVQNWEIQCVINIYLMVNYLRADSMFSDSLPYNRKNRKFELANIRSKQTDRGNPRYLWSMMIS